MARGSRGPAGVLAAEAFEEALAAAPPPPVVAAAGPEGFLRDRVVGAAVAAVLGDPESPDAVVLHGPSRAGDPEGATLAAVLEEVATASMFSAGGRKVVVLRRADLLLGAEGELLDAYLARPAPGSLLVLESGSLPGDRGTPARVRRALEAVAAAGAVATCEAPSAEPGRGGGASPLGRWVAARARARGKRLDPADGDLLVHRSGTALATLDAAVAAAALHAGAADRITAADLEAVAPRGPAESMDRFTEALLCREPEEALRVLSGIYREGALPWGAKSPVRGEASITFLLLNQVRRVARDARGALADGGARMPPSLRYGCRDPRRVLQRSTARDLALLLGAVTDLEAALKSGVSGGERARLEALVLGHAVAP